MIFSKECIDETEGFDVAEDGSLVPRKLGRFVMDEQESGACVGRLNDVVSENV